MVRLVIGTTLLWAIAGTASASAVVLTSSATTGVFGSAVTLTATVTPATATGNVTFYDGVSVLGTSQLASGVASFTTKLLANGSGSLTARYWGDASDAAAGSTPVLITISTVPGVGFLQAGSIAPGAYPTSMASADFNGDGKADLAITNSTTYSVVVFLGNGDGSFQAPHSYLIDGNPSSGMATGDFNGDGKTDLVVANNLAYVSVLLGNGDGTFQSAVTYGSYDADGENVIVADINGDGKPDLAVATQLGLIFLLGNGDGTFQIASNFALPVSTQAIAAGDFNGDGIADVVVLGSTGCYMLQGKGDGSFQTAIKFSSVQNAFGTVVGDFNGDGKQDLAILDYVNHGFDVFLGKGDGTFGAAVSYQISGSDQPPGMAGGDFNGDGVTDIILCDPVANKVWLFQGNPDGTFQTAVPLAGGSFPVRLVVADFNGDGRADFATTTGVFVGKAPYTTTTLVSSLSPSNYGQAVTLTAAVSPAAATGSVTFYDGTTILGSASITGGNATLATSSIASGFRSLTAHYSGDSGHPGSTSVVLLQKVIALPSNGFQAGVLYPSGSGPTHIAKGDFNGDGIADLVVANPGANDVDVLLGNGDGSFHAPVSYGAGIGPDFIAVGDFNGDGKLDLAVGDSGTNNVNILPGNGDGTFQAAVGYGTTGPASSIAIGDFNGDGKADLAVAVGNGVNVLLGVGDGTFSAAVSYNGGSQPWALVAGDFNQDGKTDLAVANPGGGNVCILFGNGDGSFQNPVSYAAGSQPYAIAAGDFNHDGLIDLAVVDFGDGSVDVLLGKTGGTFQAAVNYAAGTGARSIAVEDFNGDGYPDLVVADNFGGGAVSVLFGNGKGAFQTAVNYLSGGAPDSVVIGNFTGNGRVDCAITIPGFNGVSILVSQVPPPTTTTLTSSLNPSGYGQSVTLTAAISLSTATGTVAFFDSGTLLGMAPVVSGTATLKTSQLAAGVSSLKAYYSGGTGLLSTSAILHQTVNSLPQAGFGFGVTYNARTPFAVGDFNGDGKPDLAAVGFNGVSVLLNRGGGIFNAAVNYPAGYGPSNIAVGDFNGDGYSDLAVASSANGTMSILLGNGDGTFGSATSFSVGINLDTIAVGDVNGDGKADLLVGYAPFGYGLNVYLGNGDGTFGTATNYLTGQTVYSVTTGDFNGDGIADLAVANGVSGMIVLIGSGNGNFLTAVSYPTGAQPESVAVADLNGDGIADVVTGNYGGNSVSVFLGKGDGTFQTAKTAGAGNFPLSVAAGDFNGDGKTDLAVADNNHNNIANGNVITILFGAGDGTFSGSMTAGAGANPAQVIVADFNGDSLTDLAVAGSSNLQILLGKAAVGATVASVALTSSANPSTYGQSVAITATVTPSSATGRVAFYDGGALLGTLPITGGSATLNTSLLGSGSHSLQTFYMGDSAYQATSSAALTQAVKPVATQGFMPGAGNPIAGGATSVAIDDFNGDGRPDIAEVTSGGIRILLGGSGGTFSAAPGLAISNGFQAIATGDFNGDGKPDVITGDRIFLGNGDGTFQSPLSYQIPGAWTAGNDTTLFVTDFNGDGFADALVTSAGQNNWVILLGNGDGTFAATTYTGTGALGLGDFNGDGKPDVLLIETSIAGRVSIVSMLGNGDGTFSASTGYVLGASSSTSLAPSPVGAVTGDFDGDGKLDVAVIMNTYASQGQVSALVVLKGNGDGTLQLANQYAVPGTANSLVTGDFDGDGKQDIAVGNSVGNFGSTGVAIYYGQGNGSFKPVYPFAAPVAVLVAGDFNGDGRTDLLAGSSSQLDLFFGLTPLIPTTVTLTASPSTSIYHQAVTLTATISSGTTGAVDFYQGTTLLGSSAISGGTAVLTASILTSWGGTLTAVYGGDATHGIGYSAPVATTTGPISENGLIAAGAPFPGTGFEAMADVNGDGNIDLIRLTATGVVEVLRGNGDGTFQAPLDSGSGYSGMLLVGDFNGDGKPDLVIGGDTVSLLPGNGDGTFQAAKTVVGNLAITGLISGDFNGDGKRDIAFTSFESHSVGVLTGNGDGTFRSAVAYYDTAVDADAIVAGDFNSDGKTDLAVANYDTNNVSVLIGIGDGTFQNPVNYAVGQAPQSIVAADFNGDGFPDLATGNIVGNSVSVLLGNASGTFTTAVNYPTGQHPSSMAAGDFNGDGKIDLVLTNAVSRNLSIMTGNGKGAFSASPYTVLSDPVLVQTADMNNDGRTDIAVLDGVAGVSILLGRAPGPDLTIAGTHSGTFSVNGSGFVYTLTVSNTGNASSSGIVTVTDILPAGLTATASGGTGWSCDIGTLTCVRSDALTAAASYPAITVTVGVAGNTAANVTNTATVSGGGDVNTLNNTAADPTVISPVGQTPQTITFTSPGNQTGPAAIALSVSSNSGLTVIVTSNTPLACTVSGATVTPVIVGTCSVTASQPGDATYAAATPVTQTFTITSLGTAAAIVLSPSANPSAFGQPLTLTASVMPATATGHVTFYNGVTVLGTGTLANGTAALTTGLITSGVDSLRAYYGGDATYKPAGSSVLSQTITAAPAIGFAPQVTYVAGANPQAIAQGDFNGDGKADLAVVIGGGVVILPGNGDGTFQAASSNIITLQYTPTSMVAGDFNGDGRTDIAIGYIVNFYGTVNVLLNNGNGTFTPGTPVSVGGPVNVNSLTAADFNGDGILDLGLTDGFVQVLLGNVDGTFTAGVQYGYGSGSGVADGAVDDFNHDGKPDFALALGRDSEMYVVAGNGDRTLQNRVIYPATAGGMAIVAGDFNGDGWSDIAVASQGASQAYLSPGTLSVYLNNGDGTFQTPLTYITGPRPNALTIGDFNGDGKRDLAVTSQDDNGVRVFQGNGDGTFLAGVLYATGTSPLGVLAGDFNGDGRTDLVVANSSDNTVSVLLGTDTVSQTITFTQPGNVSLGASPFALSATASSGLTVAFASSNTAVCTVNGSTVTIVGAGTCSIVATQAGNSTTGAAPPVAQSFLVGRGSQTIQFLPLADSVFGAPFGPGLGVTASSGLAVTVTSNTPPICSISNFIIYMNAVGTCSITATQAGDTNWNAAAPVTQTFAVSKGSQSINFDPPQSVVLSSTPTTLFASAFNGMTIIFSSSTPSVCTVSGALLRTLTTGTCIIVASQPGNANYLAAVPRGESFPIIPPPTLSPISVTPSTASGLTQTLTAVYYDPTGVADLSAVSLLVNTTQSTTAACYAQYLPGSNSLVLFDDTGLVQVTGSVTPGDSATLSNSQCTLASGGVVVSSGNVLTVPFTITTKTGFSGSENVFGMASPLVGTSSGWQALGTWSVPGLPQTISFAPLPNIPAGTAPFSINATASSGLPVVFAATTPVVCAVSGNTVTILLAGGCSVTATQAGNSTYAAASTTQRFTVWFGDVAPGDSDYAAINAMAQHGITSGCGVDVFCPNDNVTRDQMAIFIVRAIYGSDNFTYTTTPYFNDVTPTTFGFKWIQKLRDLGITNGCTVSTYCPGEAVARDQMAIFIIRARLGVSIAGTGPTFTYPSTPYFTDANAGNEFAYPWIQRMKLESITNGCTATTYCGTTPVTRGEMAIFIMRGAFNQFLPAGTPVISQISPAILPVGTTGTYTVTGSNTNFVQGTTQLSPIPGVTIGAITVNSATSMTVQLTAGSNAVAQPYSILAITGSEQAVVPNGLVIQ